jgi:HK97 family phage prohead protease
MNTLVESARGAPWLRKAGELVDVSYPERTIELIVIPYEHEIEVEHPTKRNGGRVREMIMRGAFDGIERRANRVRANREHDTLLTFGRVSTFHTGHQQGLHGKIRVANTPLGDETLALAEDGCLDASAGFWPKMDERGKFVGIEWDSPSRYKITKAFLNHVALVSDGAYGEKAGVLAVRAAAGPVENAVSEQVSSHLNTLDVQGWREREAAINAKYGIRAS